MNNQEYIKSLKYADLTQEITKLWPIIPWVWFGFQIKKHLVSPSSKIGKEISKTISFSIIWLHVIMFLIWLIPLFFMARDIFLASFLNEKTQKIKFEPTKASLPPGVGYCMNTKVKKKDAKKGVVAYWDYGCEGANYKFITTQSQALLERFYYVNYAIFLIILLVYNALLKYNILNNKFIVLNIRFALLLGTIGCILPVFASHPSFGQYMRSLWFNKTWSSLSTMNCCCFMLIGLSIMTYGIDA